jgi:hypothetical protein
MDQIGQQLITVDFDDVRGQVRSSERQVETPAKDVLATREYQRQAAIFARWVWGIGRHQLGSHIFDYWQDPWGRVHEHWTDTDTLNADSAPGLCGTDDLNRPWGDPIPPSFLEPGMGSGTRFPGSGLTPAPNYRRRSADPRSRDQLGSRPEDCPSDIRHIGGAKPEQALVWNVRTRRPDTKGEVQMAENREDQSTDRRDHAPLLVVEVRKADIGTADQRAGKNFLQHRRCHADDTNARAHIEEKHRPDQSELRRLMRVPKMDMAMRHHDFGTGIRWRPAFRLDAFSLPDPISMRVSSPWPTDARGHGSPSIRRSRCYW